MLSRLVLSLRKGERVAVGDPGAPRLGLVYVDHAGQGPPRVRVPAGGACEPGCGVGEDLGGAGAGGNAPVSLAWISLEVCYGAGAAQVPVSSSCVHRESQAIHAADPDGLSGLGSVGAWVACGTLGAK